MEDQKKATLNLKDSAVQYVVLSREVDTNRQLYDGVLQRMREMGVAAQVRTSNVYIVDQAEIPGAPSYPNKRRSLLLGLLIGLAGGVGLAFLLERLDNTLKTPEESERYLRLPNLAVIPDFQRLDRRSALYLPYALRHALTAGDSASNGSRKELVLAHPPLSVVAESYRTLRAALLLSRAGQPPRSILFTSSTRQEGKTTTAVNTAIVFAQMGIRVALIDADLRRPRCHKLLSMENNMGLAELLAGHVEWKHVVRATPTDNLHLITAGSSAPNPAELVGSTRMKEVLTLLQEEYDCVLVDSAPVMPVSDAVLLATIVDGVVLVVDSQKTPKQVVRDVRARFTNFPAKILGVVLNRLDTRSGDYASYYRHYYHYYHQEGSETSE
jgi:capsular exopolysaccharide synthesis family protein